jgi:hypothetical protein
MKTIQTIIIMLLVLTIATNAVENNSTEQDKGANIQTYAVNEQSRTAEDILKEQPKDYQPLAVLSMLLVWVLGFGGITLLYLYRKGYI